MFKPEYENKMHEPSVKDKCTLQSGLSFSINEAIKNKETLELVCDEPNIIKQLSYLRKTIKNKDQIEALLSKVDKVMNVE